MRIGYPTRLLMSIFTLAAALLGQGDYYLHDGDTVVFYGDSITEQGFYNYFLETFTITRFPSRNIRFINSGWGGDRVSGGAGGPVDLRLARDVVAYAPTVVTCMLGMNDGGYQAYDETLFQQYSIGYQHIVDSLTAQLPGVRISLFEPSAYDEVTRPVTVTGGYNSVLIRYGTFVAGLAQSQSALCADLNAPTLALLQAAYKTNPATANTLYFDQIHPAAGASLVMAEAILKAWNAPSYVFRVELDADAGTVTRSDNTTITNFQVSQTGRLTWTQLDGSLPMPVDQTDPTEVIALLNSDFLSALNQQPIQVTGLIADSYELRIDDTSAGVFTRAQLQSGIDLAGLPTAMAAQAAQVHSLTWTHNLLHFNGWRGVQVPLAPYTFSNYRPTLDAISNLEQQIVASQRATALPQRHNFELRPN